MPPSSHPHAPPSSESSLFWHTIYSVPPSCPSTPPHTHPIQAPSLTTMHQLPMWSPQCQWPLPSVFLAAARGSLLKCKPGRAATLRMQRPYCGLRAHLTQRLSILQMRHTAHFPLLCNHGVPLCSPNPPLPGLCTLCPRDSPPSLLGQPRPLSFNSHLLREVLLAHSPQRSVALFVPPVEPHSFPAEQPS